MQSGIRRQCWAKNLRTGGALWALRLSRMRWIRPSGHYPMIQDHLLQKGPTVVAVSCWELSGPRPDRCEEKMRRRTAGLRACVGSGRGIGGRRQLPNCARPAEWSAKVPTRRSRPRGRRPEDADRAELWRFFYFVVRVGTPAPALTGPAPENAAHGDEECAGCSLPRGSFSTSSWARTPDSASSSRDGDQRPGGEGQTQIRGARGGRLDHPCFGLLIVESGSARPRSAQQTRQSLVLETLGPCVGVGVMQTGDYRSFVQGCSLPPKARSGDIGERPKRKSFRPATGVAVRAVPPP